MSFKVCKEVDLHDYDYFSDFADDVGLECCVELVADESELPCYFNILRHAEQVAANDIPIVLEAAMHFTAGDESIIMVSVNSQEPNYKDWLQVAEDYPGATIMKIERNMRTVYCLLFPGTPAL